MTSLHDSMIRLGHEDLIESNYNITEHQIDTKTNQLLTKSSSVKRTVFRASKEMSIVEINSDKLIFKTSDYHGHERFFEVFESVVRAMEEYSSQFRSCLMKSITLRYVDAITPTNGYVLEDFLDNFKPVSVPLDNDLQKSSKISYFTKTSECSYLISEMEEVSPRNGRVIKLLPIDLMEKDKRCAMRLPKKDAWENLGEKNYAVFDIKHVHTFEASPKYQKDVLMETIRDLHKPTSDIFWSTLSEIAKKSMTFRRGELC